MRCIPSTSGRCKWLLMTHDRVFTNEFKLTHEFLGMMLGVESPTCHHGRAATSTRRA